MRKNQTNTLKSPLVLLRSYIPLLQRTGFEKPSKEAEIMDLLKLRLKLKTNKKTRRYLFIHRYPVMKLAA